MPEIHPVLALAAMVAGPSGAAWVAVRVALNGLRQDVQRVERKLDELDARLRAVEMRTAAVETKVAG